MNTLEAITKVRCLVDNTVFSTEARKEGNKALKFLLDKIDDQGKRINYQKAETKRVKDVLDDYIKAKTKFRQEAK